MTFVIIPPFVIESTRRYEARIFTASDAIVFDRLWRHMIFENIRLWLAAFTNSSFEETMLMIAKLEEICELTPEPDPVEALAATIARYEDFMHFSHEDLIKIAKTRIEAQLRAAVQLEQESLK